MEFIILIIVVVVILYFIGRIGGSKSSSKTSSTAVKNHVDDKKVYSMEEAVQTIGKYMYLLGFKQYEEGANRFPKIINRVIAMHEKEIKDCEQEITLHNEHYEKQVADFGDEESEEDFREDADYEIKKIKKQIVWYERQIKSYQGDLRLPMKKFMNYCKREEHYPTEALELDLPKELPDSYY